MKATRRIAAIATAIAVLMSPVIATSASAAVAEITGTTSGYNATWLDVTLDASMKVGVSYTSSFQAPDCCTSYDGLSYDLPDGLEASLSPSGIVTVTGAPTTPEMGRTLAFTFGGSDGASFGITFAGFTIEPDTTPTTTTVTTADFARYTLVTLTATVNAQPGGIVSFYFDSTLIGTEAVVAGGVAIYYGPVPSSFTGQSPVVTAVYGGDADYAPSTSTNDPTVYIYGSRTLHGTVSINGNPSNGELVTLLDPTTKAATGYQAATDANGAYAITLSSPTTLAEAQATYLVYANTHGMYYSPAGGVGQPNVFQTDAAAVGQSQWLSALNLFMNVAPVWADQALAQPRLHSAYSDAVSATPFYAEAISYSVSAGTLPSWLTLSTAGALTATDPTDQLPHTFTVTAASLYGTVSKQFTLQATDAGVAPTFTDTTIADPQVGTALTDGVLATGDPTIVYTSTTLPPGLTLDSATGALAGTPTTAGDYVVTFTATNDFGDDTYVWEPTIAEAPEINLVLNFAAGTALADAKTEIGADGLLVGSTYTLDMHSTPVRLYTGIVDGSGGFTWLVTLPANTPVGAHELILTGVAPDGTVMTAHAWFTLLPNGTIGAVSYTGAIPFRLAATGSEPLVPLGIASALLVAGFLATRRSRAVLVP